MSAVVSAPIAVPPDTLVVLDAERRLYVGLSRDGSYYHLIRPLRPEDYRVREELGKAGQLACDCVGFSSHGHCYQAALAIAHEGRARDEAAAPKWMRRAIAPETELETAARRG
jgi:hypothetical protein